MDVASCRPWLTLVWFGKFTVGIVVVWVGTCMATKSLNRTPLRTKHGSSSLKFSAKVYSGMKQVVSKAITDDGGRGLLTKGHVIDRVRLLVSQ